MCFCRYLLTVLILGALGCAGHAATTEEARSALDAGAPKGALAHLNEQLGVPSAEKLPTPLEDDQVLYVLDRAMVLQQLGQHRLVSRDLEAADKQLMVLDFSRNTGDELGRFLFSDDSGPYRAPAYEKLLVNTMNMMSYLARRELSGARVEARRLTVLGAYFKNSGEEVRAFMGPGSYLAGFVFEKSGRPQEALRHYDEALRVARFTSLYEPVRRLSTLSGYRTPRLQALLDGSPAEVLPETHATTPPPSELLIVVNYGRVPAKIAERVPIGLALTYASTAMSPADRAQANSLALQGLVTWVNYPSLEKRRPAWDFPRVSVNGAAAPLDAALSVDGAARAAFEEVKGTIVAASITRMIARVVAGEAVRRTTDDGVLGLLLSLGTQATLTATDTPDTRSWSTLPGFIAIGRLRVQAGTHMVRVAARGQVQDYRVDVPEGGYAAVIHTVLR